MPPVGDRDEIAAIVHRYAELLDGGDVEGVVALFSRATWRSAATGTVLRTARLDEYAAAAGFSAVEVLPVDHAMFRLYRLR